MLHALAKPQLFSRISAWLLPFSALASLGLLAWGFWLALMGSPPDYQQGETVRIMYIHVPAAYLATLGYAAMALCGLFYLVWKHPLADMIAQSIAPVGATFALVTLITGSIWGKPTWGAWWVWDARLTSMLILFFFYVIYMALEGAFDFPARERQVAAILTLIGAVNLPIIKFSVEWWNTLHQPASLLRMDGPTLDTAMLHPLLVLLAGFTAFFLWMVLLRVQILQLARRARRR